MHPLPYSSQKPTGGARIISLLTTLCKWWEALRVEQAFKWKEANARDYFWGGAGKGAAACAWKAALLAESAPTSADFCSAGSIGDLRKAYERVDPEIAWECARRTGFPLRLAAWITSLFTGPRWLVLNGSAHNKHYGQKLGHPRDPGSLTPG